MGCDLSGASCRLGVFGGTFDPIHIGHLIAAQEVWAALRLDRVLFVPAGEPPHKRGLPVTPAEHRVAMVALAIQDNPAFVLSRIEVDRPGPSYTVDTLRQLRATWPAAELFLIIGADELLSLPTWREPATIAALAQIVAVARPGVQIEDLRYLEPWIPEPQRRIHFVSMPLIGISATDLRRRVAEGRPIRYQVPDAVMQYIYEHRLYRFPAEGAVG